MKTLLVISTIHFSILFSPLNYHSAISGNYDRELQDSFLKIAKDFLSAKEKSFQEKATKEDVNLFLSFCSDSVQYDHFLSPEKKFSFTGKEQWRDGAISHLGETRNAKIEIVKSIERQNIIIIEYNLYREIKTNGSWKKDSKKTTVSVLQFDKDKKIKKITDYL